MSNPITPITEDDIANFLVNTPDFFERHAALLSTAGDVCKSRYVFANENKSNTFGAVVFMRSSVNEMNRCFF